MKENKIFPWGTYSPNCLSRLILLLTKAGLGRGRMTYKINNLWKLVHGNIVDLEIRKIKYRLNLTDNITDIKILCSSKVYDKKELRFLKEACQNRTFVDVGANIGYYSLYMAHNGANRIISIEPNPIANERLRFNIETNKISESFTLYDGAVGSGKNVLFDVSKDLGCSSIVNDSFLGKTINVETQPLLKILSNFDIDEIGALKIDIEGYEEEALIPFFKAADRDFWPKRLVIEDAHKGQWNGHLIHLLERLGYRLHHKTRSNLLLKLNS